jgi:hypothetical protein
MESITIHDRGYTAPKDCAAIGHRYRSNDLRVCVRCGFHDVRYPVGTRLVAEDYPSEAS